MEDKYLSLKYFPKCPCCGIQPYLRIEPNYDHYDLKGPYSLWHGHYDDGCLGVMMHHKWFNTPEEVEQEWLQFISQVQTRARKPNMLVLGKEQI